MGAVKLASFERYSATFSAVISTTLRVPGALSRINDPCLDLTSSRDIALASYSLKRLTV